MMTMRKPKHSILTLAAALLAACASCLFAPAAQAQNRFELNDEQFNQWVYQGQSGKFDPDSELNLAMESVERVCPLDDVQKDKLRLAASGDFARFEQRVADLRTQYVGKSYDQNDIGNIYQKIQPLTAAYQAGLLGPASLFTKVLHRTLTLAQLEEYEAAEGERIKARHAAKVRLFVAIYERTCPLTDKQRTKLIDVLLADTRPPKRSSEYDWYIVMVQAARIPEAKLAAILDEAQMRRLKKSTLQARGMEGFLKQQGLLPDP